MCDWQVGDLALCIRAANHAFGWYKSPLKVGGIYTVERVVVSEDGLLGLGFVGIEFRGCTLNATLASSFRKLTPPPVDAFDREVIEQMTGAPVECI